MDKLSAMHTFVRVVESGSFSAVADELGSTQSAISKQVAALEKALGAKLLIRTTRSLALSDAGERYFAQARRLVAEIAEAESDLVQGEGQLRGSLRVAASVGYARLKLMPLVKSFLRAHPLVLDARRALPCWASATASCAMPHTRFSVAGRGSLSLRSAPAWRNTSWRLPGR